jgi:Holliday junction resolvase RusA-like endonuclease
MTENNSDTLDLDRSPNWVPLSRSNMPEAVQSNFDSEFPIGSALRAWVIAEFETQTRTKFDPNSWSKDAAIRFRKWWWYQLEQGDFIFRKKPTLQHMLHPSLSAKANALSQRHCPVCNGLLEADAQFPISNFPVRLAPESRQSLDQVNWAAFQAAIKHWFEARTLNLGPSRHLCIAVTYALNESRNDRDLDNMTKALMDAFSRAIGFNDKDIHHLDVLKIFGDTNEEYVFIRVAPSYLYDNTTVMVPVFDGAWGVEPPLILEDFKNV